MDLRENITLHVEKMAADFRASGACAQWFNGADAECRQIAKDVNGPLAE